MLTSLLDYFGTCSLGIVCADNAVKTVLDTLSASSGVDSKIPSTYHVHVELGSEPVFVSKLSKAISVGCRQ